MTDGKTPTTTGRSKKAASNKPSSKKTETAPKPAAHPRKLPSIYTPPKERKFDYDQVRREQAAQLRYSPVKRVWSGLKALVSRLMGKLLIVLIIIVFALVSAYCTLKNKGVLPFGL